MASSLLRFAHQDFPFAFQVVVPATNGSFGIMKDHVPTIAQLDAGLMTVHGDEGEDKYFVAGDAAP